MKRDLPLAYAIQMTGLDAKLFFSISTTDVSRTICISTTYLF